MCMIVGIDTSATETEDETPHGRSRKAKNKKKKEKRKDKDGKDKMLGQGKKVRKASGGGTNNKTLAANSKKTLLKPLSPLGKRPKALVKKSPVKTKVCLFVCFEIGL